MRLHLAALTAAILASASATPALSQDFYAGKTITILIPAAAGGGLDQQAQLLGDYWSKYIPGQPNIITRSMDNGSAMMNFIEDAAKPDGLTLTFGDWNSVGVVLGTPGHDYSPEDMIPIGAGGPHFATMVRTDITPPLEKPADIVNAERFALGGRRADAAIDMTGNLALDIMGVNYNYVGGYGGMSKIFPAVLQNEIQAGHTGMTGYFAFWEDGLVKDGKAMAIWYAPTFDIEGNPDARPKGMPEQIPSFVEVYNEVHGKDPSGPQWEALKWIATNVNTVTFSSLAPAGVPEDRIADLRKGWEAAVADPDYEAAVIERYGVATRWISFEQFQHVLNTFRDISPEALAALKEAQNK